MNDADVNFSNFTLVTDHLSSNKGLTVEIGSFVTKVENVTKLLIV